MASSTDTELPACRAGGGNGENARRSVAWRPAATPGECLWLRRPSTGPAHRGVPSTPSTCRTAWNVRLPHDERCGEPARAWASAGVSRWDRPRDRPSARDPDSGGSVRQGFATVHLCRKGRPSRHQRKRRRTVRGPGQRRSGLREGGPHVRGSDPLSETGRRGRGVLATRGLHAP